MKKYFFITTLLILSYSRVGAQHVFPPIDTLVTEKGTILIYSDRSWEYLHEQNFSGIMCPTIDALVTTDTNFLYKSFWKTDATITCTSNDVNNMKDTIWMCVIDSLHNNYAIPFEGRITSRYGRRHGRNHNGIDIDLETGDTIYAAFDGKIRYAQYHDRGFGNLVIIRHFNGLETYYGHCSKLLVGPYQDVKAGDPIALGGNTGRSTGSHLHFEVRFYDNPINPELVFDFEQKLVNDNLLVHSGIFRPGGSSVSSSSVSYDKNSKTHKVRSGDTLGKIAGIYGTSVSKLCQLNNIKETDILHIGQVLKVR